VESPSPGNFGTVLPDPTATQNSQRSPSKTYRVGNTNARPGYATTVIAAIDEEQQQIEAGTRAQ